jgi:type IV secretion system protein VirB6
MTAACSSSGAGDIAALLSGVDCYIALYVERAYARLFGEAGWLMPALIGGLTIYVAFYGYRLMLGGSVRLPDLMRRFIAIGATLAFVTNWPAYQTVFVSVVSDGADDVAAALHSAATGAAPRAELESQLGATLDTMTALAAGNPARNAPAAATAVDTAPPRSPAGVSAATMIWLSAVLLGVSSAGVLIIVKASLGLLLAIGPAFVFLALFRQTRGLTEGWLRTISAGMLALIFTTLATAMALVVVDPMVAGLAAARAAGRSIAEPAFTLMIACIVLAMFVRQILSVTTRLAAAWRLTDDAREQAWSSPSHIATQSTPVVAQSRAEAIAAAAGAASQAPARTMVALHASAALGERETAADPRDAMRRAARAYRGFGAQSASIRPAAARGAT